MCGNAQNYLCFKNLFVCVGMLLERKAICVRACMRACVHVCVLSALECSRRSVLRYSTSGSAITNGREPRSCLGRVFNSKLGHSATLGSKCMVGMQPLLKLKTQTKARPVS